METHDLPTPHPALTTDDSHAALHRLRALIQNQIEKDLDRIDDCLSFLDLLDRDGDLEPDVDGEDSHERHECLAAVARARAARVPCLRVISGGRA